MVAFPFCLLPPSTTNGPDRIPDNDGQIFLFTLQVFGGVHSENFHRQRIHAFHVLQNEVREYVFLTVVAQRLDEGTFFLP